MPLQHQVVKLLLNIRQLRQADIHMISFGTIRMWGSIGFGLSSLIIGQFLNSYGVEFMMWPYLILGTLLLVIAFNIVDAKTSTSTDTKQVQLKDLKVLFTNKKFIIFLSIMMFITITHRANDSFIGLFITSIGGSESLVGIAWFIALISEALIFAFAYYWFKKERALLFLILASVFYTLRWLLFAFTTDPTIVIIGQLLHGLTFGIFYLSALDYVTQLIPKTLNSSGHLIFYSVFFGISGIIGSLIGGFLLDQYGGQTLYLVMAGMTLIGTVLLIIFTSLNQKKPHLN